MLNILNENIASSPLSIKKLINDFVDETKGELWDSEKELVEHYKKQNNYLKLQKGEVGGNLIYKYKSKSLVESGLDWITYFEQEIFKAVKKKQSNIIYTDVIKLEISEIEKFCRLKMHALLNPKINTKPVED